MKYRLFLLLVLLPSLTPPVNAGIIFGRKKDKPDPRQRVPELISTLKSDRDADKRSRAADELRNYDTAQFPEIIPALIEALQSDRAVGVRVEAAQSLGKIRPVSQPAGEALEHALARDPSMRVRLQARSTLLMYHWAGYRTGKKGDTPPPLNTTREPPVAVAEPTPPVVNTVKPAESRSRLLPRPTGPRPMPSGPAAPPVSTKEPPLAPPLDPPANPGAAEKPTTPQESSDGPRLP